MIKIEDLQLVREVKEAKSQDALLELVERHSGLFHKTISKNLPFSKNSWDVEELVQRKEHLFYEAIETFDPDRNIKFHTWLANKTKYLCLSQRSKLRDEPDFCEFDEGFGGETHLSPYEYLSKKEEVERILFLASKRCTPKALEIFEKKYFGGENNAGLSFTEIAKEMEISPQAVQASHAKTLKVIKKAVINENII